MEGLRPFRMEDVEALIPLIAACEEEDRSGFRPSVESLRHQIAFPGIDVENHCFVLPDSTGALIASAGAIPIPGPDHLTFQMILSVHPEYRPRGLEDELLGMIEAHAAEYCAQTQSQGVLHTGVQAQQQRFIDLYTRHGYHVIRWFLELERDLSEPILDAPLPPDIRIRRMDPERDIQAYYLAMTDSFQDHWDPHDLTLEQITHMVFSPSFRPDLTLLAFGEDGEPAGLCAGQGREERNRQNGTQEGYISTVGVRRPFRRRGLARALLTQSMRLLQEAGRTMAVLHVDADSPTGATRLYESVGFRERKRSLVFEKPVGAPAAAKGV
ncbi:MAG TPA: GNAT family N-acetyltransferase [Chthonomonadaceae bacterium]|nr:GNAT family N-acetyltransferase [Chthonomonadaceae bacterium]